MRRIFAGSVALLGLAGVCAPVPAHACLHVVEFTKDDAIADVDRADRLLTRGEARDAYRVARRARRELEQDAGDRATAALITRARRITALAVVRLDGDAPITSREARRGITRGRHDRALRWALEELRTAAMMPSADLRAQLH